MRHLFFLILLGFLITISTPQKSQAQYKKDLNKPALSEWMTTPQTSNGLILGFLDPARIHMQNSVSMNYLSFGGSSGMMQNVFMNTLNYRISEKMQVTTNLGILSTPIHPFGADSELNKPKFFGGAEMRYQMSDHSSFLLRIESNPYQYYYSPLQRFMPISEN